MATMYIIAEEATADPSVKTKRLLAQAEDEAVATHLVDRYSRLQSKVYSSTTKPSS